MKTSSICVRYSDLVEGRGTSRERTRDRIECSHDPLRNTKIYWRGRLSQLTKFDTLSCRKGPYNLWLYSPYTKGNFYYTPINRIHESYPSFGCISVTVFVFHPRPFHSGSSQNRRPNSTRKESNQLVSVR